VIERVQAIVEGAAAVGVRLTAAQAQGIARFGDLVLKWNETHNLVSATDSERFLPRHLVDSLSVVPFVRGKRLLDLGSGAGLPGIPVAFAAPDVRVVLLDRSQRKLRFARQAVIELGLENVEVVVADAREYRPERLFDTVVARAVMPPVGLWGVARTLLADGGVLLVQCGDPATLALPRNVTIDHHRVVIPGLDAVHWVLELSESGPVAQT